MSTKQRAFVLHFLVPYVGRGKDLVITEVNQPYACAMPDVLVGLHGQYCEHHLPRLFNHLIVDGQRWREVKILVRPTAEAIGRRERSSLRGMHFFDGHAAKVPTKLMMGDVWRRAAEATAARYGVRFTVPDNVNWEMPESYMAAFPDALAEVFRMLPDLEVMISFVKVGNETIRVAVVPMAKLKRLAEFGEEQRSEEHVKVRRVCHGKTTHIRLPKKAFTSTGRLQTAA